MCFATPQQETRVARPRPVFPARARLHPLGVRLRPARSAHHRCASPREGEHRRMMSNLQKDFYTDSGILPEAKGGIPPPGEERECFGGLPLAWPVPPDGTATAQRQAGCPTLLSRRLRAPRQKGLSKEQLLLVISPVFHRTLVRWMVSAGDLLNFSTLVKMWLEQGDRRTEPKQNT